MTKENNRPYWHVDLKWIFGIIFSFVLSLTLFSSTLMAITAEKPAIETMTIVTASMFSRHGLDDKKEIEKVKQKIEKSPQHKFQPIPNVDFYLTKKDIENRSPRQIRLSLFKKMIEPAYKEGTEAVKKRFAKTNKETQSNLGLLEFVNERNHAFISMIFYILLLICLASIIPLVKFCNRFGKLFAPGFIMVLVSFFPAAILNFMNLAIKTHSPAAAPNGREMGQYIGYTLSNIAPIVLPVLLRSYSITFIVGIILMISALLGKIFWKRFRAKIDALISR